jgi:glutamate synthase domain-containing protein 3
MAERETKTFSTMDIDTDGISTRELNIMLRNYVTQGISKIRLLNVCGQRYIGTDLDGYTEIEIVGTPGNDLGAFMNGQHITVHGNAQDGCGNTMNGGEIVVHGHAGDIVGLAIRGGSIFVRDGVGYRAGIHMKEYENIKPALVIGGSAQDFLGEYMSGGTIIVLGLDLKEGEDHRSHYIGTGMHGGAIYIRGTVNDYQLGKEVGVVDLDDDDKLVVAQYVKEFADHFDFDVEKIMNHQFKKLFPLYLRPYGTLYAY